MEERFIKISDKDGEKAVPVRLPNGNLDIKTVQHIIQSGIPIVADGEFVNVAMEIIGRYPIGDFPIVPKHGRESKFVRDGECDQNKVLLEDLLMEQREGPGGG